MDFIEKAKVITSVKYNWVDTLVIALGASSTQFIRIFLIKNPSSTTDGLFNVLTITTLLFLSYVYVVKVRKIIFSRPAINFILLLPKDVNYRPRLTILGLMATIFQWVGCMLIITSAVNSPWSRNELVLSSDKAIAIKAREEAERLYLHPQLEAIAEAKPVDVTNLSPAEAHRLAQEIKDREENPEKAEQEAQSFKEQFISEKIREITPSLKVEIHKEEEKRDLENEQHELYVFWRQIIWGAIALFLGAVIEKMNNMIQISLDKKRA